MFKDIAYQRWSPRQPCIPGTDDTGATLAGYFEALFNSTNPYVVPPDTEPSPDVTSTIRPDDVMEAILRYSNKGPGPDGIHILFLKAAVERSTERRTLGRPDANSPLIRLLVEAFTELLKAGTFPAAMNCSLLTAHPKKADADITSPADFRHITLTQIVRRIFEKCFLNLITSHPGSATHATQAGFKSRYSCHTQALAAMESETQSEEEWNDVCLDITKAYDKVPLPRLWVLLRHAGMPENWINCLRALFGRVPTRVTYRGTLSSLFHRTNGILQGSIVGPQLFIIYMDSLAVTLAQFRPKLLRSYLIIDDTRIQAPRSVSHQPFLDDIDALGRKSGFEQGVIKPRVRSTDLRHAAPTLRINRELITPTLADAPWNTRYLPPKLAPTHTEPKHSQ